MSDFSRTLALLRREKKISQRAAAGDLGVSQALLSHYENGLREPGLSFVVRAADYYGVSCDYLLGRSMARDGSAVPAERMEGTATETEHSQIVQALLVGFLLLFQRRRQLHKPLFSQDAFGLIGVQA